VMASSPRYADFQFAKATTAHPGGNCAESSGHEVEASEAIAPQEAYTDPELSSTLIVWRRFHYDAKEDCLCKNRVLAKFAFSRLRDWLIS